MSRVVHQGHVRLGGYVWKSGFKPERERPWEPPRDTTSDCPGMRRGASEQEPLSSQPRDHFHSLTRSFIHSFIQHTSALYPQQELGVSCEKTDEVPSPVSIGKERDCHQETREMQVPRG